MLVLIQGLTYNQRHRDLRFAVKRNVDFEGLISASSSGFLANGPYSSPVYYGVSGSYYMVSPYISDLYNSPMYREVTFCFDSAFKYGGVALLSQYKGAAAFHKRFGLHLRDNFAIMLKFRKTYYYLTPQGNIFCTFRSPFTFSENTLRYNDFILANRAWTYKKRWVVVTRSYLQNSTPLFGFISNSNVNFNFDLKYNLYVMNWNFLAQLNNGFYFNRFSNVFLSNHFAYNGYSLSFQFFSNVCNKFYFFKVKDLSFVTNFFILEEPSLHLNFFTILFNIILSLKFFVYLFSNKFTGRVVFLLANYLLMFLFDNIFNFFKFIFNKMQHNSLFLLKIMNEFLAYLSSVLTYFFISLKSIILVPAFKFFWFFSFSQYVVELNFFNYLIFKKINFCKLTSFTSKNVMYANYLFLQGFNFNKGVNTKMFLMSNFGLAKYFQFVDTRGLFTLSNVSANWSNFIAARPRIRRIKVQRLFMARPLSWTRRVFLESFLRKSKFKAKFYVWTKIFYVLFPIVKRVYEALIQLRLKNFVNSKAFSHTKQNQNQNFVTKKHIYAYFFRKAYKKLVILLNLKKVSGGLSKRPIKRFCLKRKVAFKKIKGTVRKKNVVVKGVKVKVRKRKVVVNGNKVKVRKRKIVVNGNKVKVRKRKVVVNGNKVKVRKKGVIFKKYYFLARFRSRYFKKRNSVSKFFIKKIDAIIKTRRFVSKGYESAGVKLILKNSSTLLEWLDFKDRVAFYEKSLKLDKRIFQWHYCKFMLNSKIQNLVSAQVINANSYSDFDYLSIILKNLKRNMNDLVLFFKEVYVSFNRFFFFIFLSKFNFKNFDKLSIVLKNKLFLKYLTLILIFSHKSFDIVKYFFRLYSKLKFLFKSVLILFFEFTTFVVNNVGLAKQRLMQFRYAMLNSMKPVLAFVRKKKYIKVFRYVRFFKSLTKYFRYAKLRMLFKYKQVIFKKKQNHALFDHINLFEQLRFGKVYKFFLNSFMKKYFWLFQELPLKGVNYIYICRMYFYKEFYFYINMKFMSKRLLNYSIVPIMNNSLNFRQILQDTFRYYNYLNRKCYEFDYTLHLKNIFYFVYKRFFLFTDKLNNSDIIFVISCVNVLYLYVKFFSKYLNLYSCLKQGLNKGVTEVQMRVLMLSKILRSFYVFFILVLNYIFNIASSLAEHPNNFYVMSLFNGLGLFTVNYYKGLFFNNFIKILDGQKQITFVKKVTSRFLWNGFFLKMRKRPHARKNMYYWHNSYRLNFFDMFSGQFLRKLHQYNRPGFLRRGFRLEFVYPETVKFVDRIARLANSVDLFLGNYTRILTQYKHNHFFYTNFIRFTKKRIMRFLDLNFHRPRFFDYRPLRRYRMLVRNKHYVAPFFVKNLLKINFFHFAYYSLFDKLFFNKIDLYKLFYFKYKVFLRSAYFLVMRFWKLKQITYIYMFLFEILKKKGLTVDFRLFNTKQRIYLNYFTIKITFDRIRILVLYNIFLLFKFFLNFRNFINFYFSLIFLNFFFNNFYWYFNICVFFKSLTDDMKINFILKFFKIRVYFFYLINARRKLACNVRTYLKDKIVYLFCMPSVFISAFYFGKMQSYLQMFVVFLKISLNKLFLVFVNRTKIRFLFKFFFVFFISILRIIFINFSGLAGVNYKSFFVFNVLNKFLSLCFFDAKCNVLLRPNKCKAVVTTLKKKRNLFFIKKDTVEFKSNEINISWNINLLKTFKVTDTVVKLPFIDMKTCNLFSKLNLALRSKYVDFIRHFDLKRLLAVEGKKSLFFDFFSYKHFCITSWRDLKGSALFTNMFTSGLRRDKIFDFLNLNFFFGIQPKFKQLFPVLLRRKILSKFAIAYHQDSIETNVSDRFMKTMISFSYLMKRAYTKYSKHKYILGSNLEILRLNKYIAQRFFFVMENYLRLKKMTDVVFNKDYLSHIFTFFVDKRGFSFLLEKNRTFNFRNLYGLSKIFDKYKLVQKYIIFINKVKYSRVFTWYQKLTTLFKNYITIYKINTRFKKKGLFSF